MVFQEEDYGHSGFDLSEEFLNQGYAPNTLMLLIAYMLLATAVMLYMVFGNTFLNQAGNIEKTPSNVGQRAYYRGLGWFIISVAAAQVLTIMDLIQMDVNNKPFFGRRSYSMVIGDDYIVGFTMVLLALSFLIYPLERYLLGRSPILSAVVSVATPMPIILRIIEINLFKKGTDLTPGNFERDILNFFWIFVIFVVVISVLFVMKLYLDLGVKSPEGSILRRRSKQVVFGLTLWVICVFLTSPIMGDISDVLSPYGPNGNPSSESLAGLIQNYNLYLLFPVIIPVLLYMALYNLVQGFKREF